MDDRRQQFDRRLSALRSERSSFVDHWRDLNDYILPRTGRFFVTDRNKGNQQNTRIIDNTATFAANTLSSGMMAGITNPARPWFQLRTQDPDLNKFQPVKEWLDLARDRMSELFLSSNLYTVLPGAYSNLGVFGTDAFALLEDHESGIRCYPYPVGSYMLGSSFRGVIDTCYREFQMTAAQIVEQFGKANCSTQVVQALSSNKDTWFDVIHAVEPNTAWDDGKLESKFKRFRSVYYEKGSNDGKFLREAGFDEFPILAPRWAVTGEDIYGRSPGMDALGDIKSIQLENKKKIQAIEKGINPPTTAPSSLKNGMISTLPGGVTFVDVHQGQQGLQPVYQIHPQWLQFLTEDIRECQARIKKAFYEDLFLMIANDTRSNITAQEIIARNEEKMLVLGPVLTRLNDELLDPLIDRTFSIMLRNDMLPPAPAELQGMDISVEYISIMAQAMKMSGISGIEHLAQFTGAMAGAFPEVLDGFDADEAVNSMASMLGVPPKLVRDEKQREALRVQRAQQAKAQQAMEFAQQGAQTAQTLADTQVTEPSALSQMMQMMGGGVAG